MESIDIIWLQKAVKIVSDGETDKMVKGNVTVYRVKNIVRIDIKLAE